MQWGLVHRVVPDGDLEAETEALVARLAAAPTVSLGLTKWLMHAGAGAPLEAHLRNEAFALELSSRSEDFREGLAAFRERREPRFRGR
jgi:2-(1,2-epoxy-1,2-dihydrophenyl)acetyl-CoA isomerase